MEEGRGEGGREEGRRWKKGGEEVEEGRRIKEGRVGFVWLPVVMISRAVDAHVWRHGCELPLPRWLLAGR